jgi:hypothetical protein
MGLILVGDRRSPQWRAGSDFVGGGGPAGVKSHSMAGSTTPSINPEDKLLRSYPGGNLTTSNVAFAGTNMDRLYTTGGEPGALFRLDLPGIKGLTILPPRSVKKGPQPARAKQVN